MAKSNVYLSVIIPSYNETANLKRGVLGEVKSYLDKQKYPWEVIVSDDGSAEEESRELAREFCQKNKGFEFLQNEHAGKHWAIWSGIQKAGGEIILFTDMDQSTPIKEVEKLLPLFAQGFQIVIGSRGGERKNFSPLRQLASFTFRNLRRSLLLGDIIDTQAGFKSLKAKVACEIFPLLSMIREKENVSGWTVSAFDVEMLYIAEKRGYKIKEIFVEWEDRDISTGKSRGSAKFVYESLDMLKQIFRVRFNDLKGYYK